MNKNLHIFSVMAGCAPIGVKMLQSYLKFHNETIHVYIYSSDSVNEIENNDRIIFHYVDEYRNAFSSGHKGTALVWQKVIRENSGSYLIQIDSDIIFKRESLSLIKYKGYPDIYGSRRCYQSNPGKSPVKSGLEDAISTYFIGFNPDFLGNAIHDSRLNEMIQGAYNPLGFPVLDFFDPVFFLARSNGATVVYDGQHWIGGQDRNGKKVNGFEANLHFDSGSHLIHFGGVGSGYAAWLDDSKMNKDYSDWAKERWNLFRDLFYDKKFTDYPFPTSYDSDGRWISGPYDEKIYNAVRKELTL